MKKEAVLVSLIIFVGLLFRIYKIDTPLGDFHSFRQADTASVARNFVEKGFDLTKPTYHDFSNVQSGKENPLGYRMVEFPIYNAMFAALYKFVPIGNIPIEVYGRSVSIFFSLITVGLVYFFLRREVDKTAAIWGSFILAVFPFSVFFSRTVLPETTALSFAFLSIFFLYIYNPALNSTFKRKLHFFLSVACFAIALLIKPTLIFFALTLLYLFITKHKWNVLKKVSVYLFFVLAVAPVFLWRNYILQYPEGIPYSEWLYGMVNTSEGWQTVFLKPAFFRWIFFERINNIILGGYLTAFLVLGIFTKYKKYFLYSVLLSSLAYLLVFEGGNVQHEYYQILILPALAMFVGSGISTILKQKKVFINSFASVLGVCAIVLFSFAMSYYRVKDYYNYSLDLLNTSKVIRDITQKDDKIVTDTLGDTTLLYLSDRKGSPHIYKTVDEFKNDNYKYLVTMDQKRIAELKADKRRSVLFETAQFAIFKL
ncbi:MAG: glycosyltransferase family 39 protein [Patescibacteria group bacterium]